MTKESNESMLYLSVDEIAYVLGISRQAVHKRIKARSISEKMTVKAMEKLLKEEEKIKGNELKRVEAGYDRLADVARRKGR